MKRRTKKDSPPKWAKARVWKSLGGPARAPRRVGFAFVDMGWFTRVIIAPDPPDVAGVAILDQSYDSDSVTLQIDRRDGGPLTLVMDGRTIEAFMCVARHAAKIGGICFGVRESNNNPQGPNQGADNQLN